MKKIPCILSAFVLVLGVLFGSHIAVAATDVPTDVSPSITIISPNGGEALQNGAPLVVRWSSTNIPASTLLEVNIYSTDGALAFGFLAPNGTPNDGVETFPTTSLPAGHYYKVIVGVPSADLSNSALSTSDESDSPFLIQPIVLTGCTINFFTATPSIINTGASSTLKWTTQGCNAISFNGAIVPRNGSAVVTPTQTTTYTVYAGTLPAGCAIFSGYSLTTGQSCADGATTKTVTVTVDAVQVQQCSDGVDNDGDGLVDYPNDPGCASASDNDETNQIQTPSITVLSPNGGEVYQAGQQITVTWTSTGYGNNSILGIDLVKVNSDTTHSNTFLMSASNLINDGTETLTIPTTVPMGTNYGIHVSIYDPTTTLWQDSFSAGMFSIQNATTPTCTINSFTASPTNIAPGGSSTLAWSTNGCNSVVINHGEAVSGNLSSSGTLASSVFQGSPNSSYVLKASVMPGCYGTVYSNTNGQPCNYITATVTVVINLTNYPGGCTSNLGYSTTSGQPCNLPEGCMAPVGYSTTTGQPCIPIDGKVGISTPPTPAAQTFVFAKALRIGVRGIDVNLLQSRLKSEGVYTGPVTGYFGVMTQQAVKQFQAKYNLPSVGNVGPLTLKLLNTK